VDFHRCLFETNPATDSGGAVYAQNVGSLSFTDCTFARNSAVDDGGAVYLYYSDALFTGCTFVANEAGRYGSAIATSHATATLDRCLVTHGIGDGLFEYSGGAFALSCSDIFGNSGGDWTGDIAAQLGVNGNISEDPQYCDPEAGNYTLEADSPCAADHSGCGLSIGAWDVGCTGTSIERRSWSRIKSAY
jgi:predicted outer membrane repeat protein